MWNSWVLLWETWILMLLVRKWFKPLTWLNSTNLTVKTETCVYVMFSCVIKESTKKLQNEKLRGGLQRRYIGVAVAGNLYTYLDKVNVCLWLKKVFWCCVAPSSCIKGVSQAFKNSIRLENNTLEYAFSLNQL